VSQDIVRTVSQDFVRIWRVEWVMPDAQRPSPKLRLLVASWPDDAPRGAIAAFCEEHGVSRSWFRKIRAIARAEGMARAIEPRSTRPAASPNRTSEDMVRLALRIRADLEEAGWDHGPLSVLDRLERTGLENRPSRATLARIFLATGVVQPDPSKKPRSALRRFVYPAPNCLWQIDATEWSLLDGSGCTIFQLIDDHSRLALASLVARSETSAAALQVVTDAIERHGVPQRFLSDNGVAFNPSRRGYTSKLVDYLTGLGVEMITGKPYKPTTQGKNERFHRTLHRWLNARPPAATITDLQHLVNEFDIAYNTLRRHQALEGKVTPQQAWDTTPIATPPVPAPTAIELIAAENALAARPAGERTIQVRPNGKAFLLSLQFYIGAAHANQNIHAIWDYTGIDFYNTAGTLINHHPWPPAGTPSIGNGRPRSGTKHTKS
jgi:putative transposase